MAGTRKRSEPLTKDVDQTSTSAEAQWVPGGVTVGRSLGRRPAGSREGFTGTPLPGPASEAIVLAQNRGAVRHRCPRYHQGSLPSVYMGPEKPRSSLMPRKGETTCFTSSSSCK